MHIKYIALILSFCLWVHPSLARPDDSATLSLAEIKSHLASNVISRGPDANRLTRSAWGPALYRRTADAVVLIYLPGKGNTDTMGSGVIVSQSGHILTNWHVVRDSPVAAVIFRPQGAKTMADLTEQDVWTAENIGVSKEKDIALLKLIAPINQSRPVNQEFTKYIQLENPLAVEVGQDVFAIGHPEGLFWSYTEGVISQIRPRYRWMAGTDTFQATVVQTQTAITHGSSGGPLINQNGKLVGIISSMLEGQAGFNFAIGVHELVPLLTR